MRTAVFECLRCHNRVWVEYDGKLPTVECGSFGCDQTVEREIALDELFIDEVVQQRTEPWKQDSDLEIVGENAVRVAPAQPGCHWTAKEFQWIEDSPWTIVNVDEGEHGPALYLER